MSCADLLGLPEAVKVFNESEGPFEVYLDVNTGDVWAHPGLKTLSAGTYCVVSKPWFSTKTITEEGLREACERFLAVLVP